MHRERRERLTRRGKLKSATSKFAVGVDIENVDRFAGPDFTRGSEYTNRIFTAAEQDYCFLYKQAAPHLAARYCAKEAIVKALASIGSSGIAYKDIEVVNEKDGRPVAKIGKESLNNLLVYVSLSHCEERALAFAVVVENAGNPAAE